MRIEEITWTDATGDDGWLSKAELKAQTLTPFHTIGYVFSEDDECVKLTMSEDEEQETYGAFMVIPKGMIKKREVLRK